MTKPGRPKADIDWAVVGKLLEAGCTPIMDVIRYRDEDWQ